MSTVVQVGDQLYRLSATQKDLIESCSATNKQSRWEQHTIMPDTVEIFKHNGWLAVRNSKGVVRYETATGWHTIEEKKEEKKVEKKEKEQEGSSFSSTNSYSSTSSSKPKKSTPLWLWPFKIVWKGIKGIWKTIKFIFKAIKWVIKIILKICTLGAIG